MIQVVNPEADEARPESIAMIAIAALGVGLVLTLGIARVMPSLAASDVAPDRAAAARAARAQLPVASAIPTRSVSATRGLPGHAAAAVQKPAARSADVAPKPTPPTAAAAPPPIAAAAPIAAKPAPLTAAAAPIAAKSVPPAVAVEAIAPAKSAPPAAASAAAPPAAAPAKVSAANPPAVSSSANAAKRHTPRYAFEQGLIAYVRCDGEERRGARFPCPRDRKLEEQVWQTLEGLTTCDADPGRGSAEVRLTLRKAQIHGVEWKPSTAGPSLNLRAVAKCAGAKLADTRTHLKAPEGLVSFRFSLK